MLIVQPDNPIGEQLKEEFHSGRWTHAWIAAAWVRKSGIDQLLQSISAFLGRSGVLRITSGVDLGHTTREGLQAVLGLSQLGDAAGFVYCNEAASVFHPKVYLFSNPAEARLYVGSSNLTASGLYSNTESVLRVDLLTTDTNYESAIQTFDEWTDTSSGLCKALDADLITALEANGYIETEAQVRSRIVEQNERRATGAGERLFDSRPVPSAPVRAEPATPAASENANVASGGGEAARSGVTAPSLPREFWIQTGALTGGSGNQLDLSMISLHGRLSGSLSFFFAMPTQTNLVQQITIRYDGVDYSGNSIKFPTTADGKGNGTWRLQLNGTSASGDRLTARCPEFRYKILTFRQLADAYYEITAVLETDQLNAVQQRSAVWDVNRGPGGRTFGRL